MSPALRSLISLAVIALSAIAVVIAVRLQPPPPPPPRDQVVPVFDFAPDTVRAIALKTDAGELRAEREAGGWKVKRLELSSGSAAAPSGTPAQVEVNQEIDALVAGIVGLPEVGRFPREERDLSVFGLDAPQAEVDLTLDSGTVRRLEIGGRTTTGAGLYARAVPPDDIIQIGSLVLSDIGATLYRLRTLATSPRAHAS